mmetsp:Transcript_47987/g.138946  ORF Transcript_47987/g.138946 Transcript_47987/m.138946 type:complete len:295 (-) Transcript_47987:12-896(-)
MARGLRQQVAETLGVVGVLAVALLAVHDVAVIVPHGAGRLEEGGGVLGVVEAVLKVGDRKPHHTLQVLHDLPGGLELPKLRPALATVALVAHLHGVLRGGRIGDGRVGAVPLQEAVAGICLVERDAGRMLHLNGPLELELRGLHQVLLHHACGHVLVVHGNVAPHLEVRLPARGHSVQWEREELQPTRLLILAVEGGLAEQRIGLAVEGGVQFLQHRLLRLRAGELAGRKRLEELRAQEARPVLVRGDGALHQHGVVLQMCRSHPAAAGNAKEDALASHRSFGRRRVARYSRGA